MPRHLQERELNRRADVGRYRPRNVSPVGVDRRRDAVRERNHWENVQVRQRSRSPNKERRRERNSPKRMTDRKSFDLHNEVSSRDRERNIRTRQEQLEQPARFEKFSEPNYTNERYSKVPAHWNEFSKDMPSSVSYSFGQSYPNMGSENQTDIPGIPEFNPESSKLNSNDWLYLLESTAEERGWKQDEKLYIMASRLAGFARQWYLSTGVNYNSWNELKDAFLKTFPVELDYYSLLKKMMARVKEDSESMGTYFLHKVALLNECEIQGVKAVSCIIAGLPKSRIQQQARMEKCEDPDQLFIYLRSLPEHEEEPRNSKMGNTGSKGGPPHVEKNKTKDCYFCGNVGHVIGNCQYIKKHMCSVCKKMGHECEPLMAKRPPPTNQVMEGGLSNASVNPKNFTEVLINGIIFKSYVDFESETITMKEEAALQTGLPIKKQYKAVRGFGGSSLPAVGYIDTSLFIDRAVANVRIWVIANNVQSIPVVVGQDFTHQPNIVTMKDSGKTRFYERTPTADTNYVY